MDFVTCLHSDFASVHVVAYPFEEDVAEYPSADVNLYSDYAVDKLDIHVMAMESTLHFVIACVKV